MVSTPMVQTTFLGCPETQRLAPGLAVLPNAAERGTARVGSLETPVLELGMNFDYPLVDMNYWAVQLRLERTFSGTTAFNFSWVRFGKTQPLTQPNRQKTKLHRTIRWLNEPPAPRLKKKKQHSGWFLPRAAKHTPICLCQNCFSLFAWL